MQIWILNECYVSAAPHLPQQYAEKMTPSRMRLGGHHAFFHHTMSEWGRAAGNPTKLKVLPSEKSKVTLFTSCGWLDRATVSYSDYLCAHAHFRPVWSMLEEVLDERRNVLRRVSWRWRSVLEGWSSLAV